MTREKIFECSNQNLKLLWHTIKVIIRAWLLRYIFNFLYLYKEYKQSGHKISDSHVGNMNTTAFWDTAPCSLIERNRRFRGAYCLHHHQGNDSSRYIPENSHLQVVFEVRYKRDWLLGKLTSKKTLYSTELCLILVRYKWLPSWGSSCCQ
jgi:hypothetical protein